MEGDGPPPRLRRPPQPRRCLPPDPHQRRLLHHELRHRRADGPLRQPPLAPNFPHRLHRHDGRLALPLLPARHAPRALPPHDQRPRGAARALRGHDRSASPHPRHAQHPRLRPHRPGRCPHPRGVQEDGRPLPGRGSRPFRRLVLRHKRNWRQTVWILLSTQSDGVVAPCVPCWTESFLSTPCYYKRHSGFSPFFFWVGPHASVNSLFHRTPTGSQVRGVLFQDENCSFLSRMGFNIHLYFCPPPPPLSLSLSHTSPDVSVRTSLYPTLRKVLTGAVTSTGAGSFLSRVLILPREGFLCKTNLCLNLP